MAVAHPFSMTRTRTRFTVDLPPDVAQRLETEVRQGRYPSVEEAIVVGARLVAGIGPRVRELLREGQAADQLVRNAPPGDGGDWL